MINQKARAEIEDVRDNTGTLDLEVNFDGDYNDCVKITIRDDTGHDTSRIIKYSDLFSFMFVLANKEQQAKMVPVTEELGHQYMKKIHVKAKKDIKEGEELIVNVPINVPKIIEDEILFELEKKKADTDLQK